MNIILQGLPYALCYLNNILVSSTTPKPHVTHLCTIFGPLDAQGLIIRLEKCFALPPSPSSATVWTQQVSPSLPPRWMPSGISLSPSAHRPSPSSSECWSIIKGMSLFVVDWTQGAAQRWWSKGQMRVWVLLASTRAVTWMPAIGRQIRGWCIGSAALTCLASDT